MVGPLSYIGGKNRLAKQIISIFPPHTTYAEPMCGGAQVLFHKAPSAAEVINDLDGEVVNLFRVAQQHHQELTRYLRFMLASRKWFEILINTPPESLTDIQKAARFLYLQKNAFGGLIRKRTYHYFLTKSSNFNPRRIPEIIEKTHDRLSNVQIECLPYEEILAKFDSQETLFYLDPPYWGPKLYKYNFTEQDFLALEARLHALKGQFVLSLNDCPEVRQLFKRFSIIDTDIAYSASKATGRRYREVLITNFQPGHARKEKKPNATQPATAITSGPAGSAPASHQ